MRAFLRGFNERSRTAPLGTGILVGALLCTGYLIYLTIAPWLTDLAGCNQGVLNKFKQTELASSYTAEFISLLQAEHEISRGFPVWEIKARWFGKCAVTASVIPDGIQLQKYIGDTFLINLKDKTISPQTDGARLFMQSYPGPARLPD